MSKFDKYDVIDALADHLDESHVDGIGAVLCATDSEDSLILETDGGDFRIRVTRIANPHARESSHA